MTELETRKKELEEITGFSDLERLAGDASDRSFFRGFDKEKNSFVIMDYSTGIKFDSKEFRIFRAYGLLKLYEIKIPKILKVYPENGVIILQDAGDNTLFNVVNEKQVSDYELKKIYLNAMNEIIKIKNIPIKLIDKIKGEKFTLDKFEWEQNFFIKYYLNIHKKKNLSSSESGQINEFFRNLNETVYSSVGFPIHRDFHSRNLLLFKGKIFNVDYQDLRTGPEHYDIVSLLWDSYVDIDDELKDYLLRRYVDFSGKEYNNDFELIMRTAIQRNLKAIATFCFLAYEKNKEVYFDYIPRTINHLKNNLTKVKVDEGLTALLLQI